MNPAGRYSGMFARSARLAALVLFLCPTLASAQAHFLPATDAGLRADVLLLVDEGVIRLPTSTWPIPTSDVLDQVDRVNVDSLAEPALQAALLRVRRKVTVPQDAGEWRLREVRVSVGEAGLLRSYDTLARDALEVQSTGGMTSERWSLTLSATGVGSPDDGRHLRLDGSNMSVRWGNWLFSANQIGRWWGPGWEGSLILSTNARPMPGISLDRIRSEPLDFPVLRWLGPWRFTGFLGRAEKYRPDVDESLFMGMRVSFKPAQILEFGLTRTAQFCGRQRPCDAKAFRNVLFGDDNAGLRVAPEDEPGNQMAGADVRIVSPFRRLPVAVYGQFIGEDNSSSAIPERYLGLWGIEWWQMIDSGNTVRASFEYSNTNCKFARPSGQDNCAYRQQIFFAGYRYHGRAIGHATDGDSESVSASLSLLRPDGQAWTLKLRRALLDRHGGPDIYNNVTQGPGESRSLELGWAGQLLGQSVSARAGFERNDQGAGRFASGGFGFVQWQKTL
jgi:hypothetical protein